MGKKEFANQQPTQNLVGRGRRGIHNTAHTKGNEVHSQLSTSLPLLAIHRAEVWGGMGGVFPLPPPFKLTKKHGLPKSQRAAGQSPISSKCPTNNKNTHTRKLHPGAELWVTWKFQEMSHVQSWDPQRILSRVSSVNITVSGDLSQAASCGERGSPSALESLFFKVPYKSRLAGASWLCAVPGAQQRRPAPQWCDGMMQRQPASIC